MWILRHGLGDGDNELAEVWLFLDPKNHHLCRDIVYMLSRREGSIRISLRGLGAP